MAETVCPNCGHTFADYRREMQPAGGRQVVLQWAICTHCGHVGLRRWEFADGVLPGPRRSTRSSNAHPVDTEKNGKREAEIGP